MKLAHDEEKNRPNNTADEVTIEVDKQDYELISALSETTAFSGFTDAKVKRYDENVPTLPRAAKINMAKYFTVEAIRGGSTDNITVIVLWLKNDL